MAEQNIKARFQLKIDTPENWAKASGFIPKKGEPIIYQSQNEMTNIKIGDGSATVSELPFILEIDYMRHLAFDTSEIVINTTTISTTSVLGQAILGQMVLA